MKRCPWCMGDLKETDDVYECNTCGREGCKHCMPKGPLVACKECRGTDEDEEDEDGEL
jgi:hypothetical protein